MQQATSSVIDNDALKAQVDAEIATRMLAEADYARYIHRRGFHVGKLNLLVDMDVASEVVEMPPLFRLPGAPSGVKGLVNRHGRVVPVVDLLALAGPESERAAKAWLLVYGRGEEAVGIMIDSLPDRKKFIPDDKASLEEDAHSLAAYVKAVYRDRNESWIELDMNRLLASIFKTDPSED